MYDRLVVHTCAPVQGWTANKWDPKLQDKRLKKLGDIARSVPWDIEHQIMFNKEMRLVADKFKSLEKTREDGADQDEDLPDDIKYSVSAEMIAREKIKVYGEDINIVPAYHSIPNFEAQRLLQEEDQIGNPAINNIGLLLRHNILVPADVNPDDAFDTAVKLAKKRAFQAERHELYTWQENMISGGTPVEVAAIKFDELLRQYNDQVKETTNRNHEHLMYTVLLGALPLIGGFVHDGTISAVVQDGTLPLAAASTIVTGVQFMRTERIDFNPGESKPAAMFYEANKALEGDFLEKLKRGARRFWHR
jgi:hypothetical protein